MRRLLRELKRRSVYKVAVSYAAVAFLTLQAAQLVFPATTLEGLYDTLVVLAFVGFPIALVIAWAFELTPEGVRRTEPAEPSGPRSREPRPRPSPSRLAMRTLAGAGLLGAAVFGGWYLTGGRGAPSGESKAATDTARSDPPAGERSIAVLPFENLSPDPDDEYFAAGVHDEILNQLFKISSLEVTSRTSVMAYAEERPKSTRAVADELGVRFVLEGTVRRFGDRVRITGQLIDAATELHVWSDTYDRKRSDLLEIQADVATEIAHALEAELTAEEVARIESRPTDDPDAYDAYLRGRDYSRSGEVAGRERREEDWRIAGEMFRRAIELDPEFARARAALAYIHLRLYWYGFDRTPERVEMARRELDEAFRLDRDLSWAYISEGYYQYWVERDYDRAITRFERGLEGLPGDAEVRSLVGFVYRRQGRLREAVEELKSAIRQDPLNGNLAEELGNILRGARRWEAAARYLNRAIALAPDYPSGYLRKMDLLVSWTGGVEGARQILREAEELVPARDLLETAVWIEILAGEPEAALERLEDYPEEMIDTQYDLHPEELLRARALELAGRAEAARRSYEAARRVLEARAEARPGQYRIQRALARTYAGLGLHERAIASIERAREGLSLEMDRWAAPDLIEDHAYVLARAGRASEAAELLRFLLENPSRNPVSVPLLRLSPRWDGIRDDPAFRALLED